MTDTSSELITHPTTEPYQVATALHSPALNGAISDSAAPEEEEPYTIKCICTFEDDDGNTVFCEGCETWQHIECYYEGNAVPDVHNCVDCEPRHLDGQRATLRQIHLRREGGDQKSKRPGLKGQKKKSKERRDHDDQANGFYRRSESSAREQPPAKRPKTNHRSSGSVVSLPGTSLLSSNGRKRASPNSTSTAKAPVPIIPLYSSDFMHLYERDLGHCDMNSNLFINLPLAADLASWVTEPAALARATNGRSARDIFTWSDTELHRSCWPTLSTESISDFSVDIDGRHPTWKILKTLHSVRKDEIVGEVKGKIGLLRDYCLDPGNRWQELRHPEPFVFFHPQLPIYIDSRHEGSVLRYARRSCRPNVTMKTYITNEVEYHFCFVAKEDIPANSEITAMWYLDQQLFDSGNDLNKQESSDSAQELAAICISKVLSHFGGCACAPPPACLLANLDRRLHQKVFDPKQSNGKRKKTRTKANISSLEVQDRAGSVGVKNAEEDERADSRSASGSARGQTRSRDLTPTRGSNDPYVFGESELSAREKRKIAAAEKKFQQLEQVQQTSYRKKKRASGQSTQNAAGNSAGYFGPQSNASVGTASRRQSYSPSAATSPGTWSATRHTSPRKPSTPGSRAANAAIAHRQYVSSGVQTDMDVDNEPLAHSPRASGFTPIIHRLFRRFLIDREQFKNHEQVLDKTALSSPPSVSSERFPRPSSPDLPNENNDIEMKDVDLPAGTSSEQQERGESAGLYKERLTALPPDHTKPLSKLPWPSTAAHNSRIPGKSLGEYSEWANIGRSPCIHGDTVSLGSVASPALSPPSTGDHASQANIPASSASAPSPVKKKLSLGDYLIKRGTLTTPTSEKAPGLTSGILSLQKSPSAQSQANSGLSSPVDNVRAAVDLPKEADASKRRAGSPDVVMEESPEPTPSLAPSHIPSVPF